MTAPGYLKHRKLYCERCGWFPPSPMVLHVDHIDADHSNNDPANLQTLCPNCHALKTLAERGLIDDAACEAFLDWQDAAQRGRPACGCGYQAPHTEARGPAHAPAAGEGTLT